MRRALAKRLIPLLMVLVLVIPYFAVSYYDVYGDDKQNLNDANSKKKDACYGKIHIWMLE